MERSRQPTCRKSDLPLFNCFHRHAITARSCIIGQTPISVRAERAMLTSLYNDGVLSETQHAPAP
jgi:hypothetical protein